MMKKTLSSVLQQTKYQKANVKIGSKGGSSFWYCGKGNNTYSIQAIKQARHNLLKQSQRMLKNYEDRLEHLDEIYEQTYKKSLKRKIKNRETYKKKLYRKKELEKINLPKKIEQTKYDINTHLLDRPVQEIVVGICKDEAPCYIIYVKGNERGSYWTIAEYNKRRKTSGEKI